jgi:hypothetical protein
LIGQSYNYNQTNYTISSGIVVGKSYIFMVRASNIYGWGLYSSQITIIASDVPGEVGIPTVYYGAGINVNISWISPTSNGESIISYEIEVLSSDGITFYQDTTDCNGNITTIVTDLYCEIPMATLTATPYNLAFGSLIQAKVRAYNINGYGPYS